MIIGIATFGDNCEPETSFSTVMEVSAYAWAFGFGIAAVAAHLSLIVFFISLRYLRQCSASETSSSSKFCRVFRKTFGTPWCFLVVFFVAKMLILIGFTIGAFGGPLDVEDETQDSPPHTYVIWGKISHIAFLFMFSLEALTTFVEFIRELFGLEHRFSYTELSTN
jgi:hypothetical protein